MSANLSATGRKLITFFVMLSALLLSSCGFHLQGNLTLVPPLRTMYLQTADPYGYLTRLLKEYLRMAHVRLVDSPAQAQSILEIISDATSQNFVTVGGSQQTRQYNLIVTVVFQVTDPKGVVLIPPESLSESRSLFLQSNQILGASNEATNFYQQMRRSLAFSIMNRLASKEVGDLIITGLSAPAVKAKTS